MNLDRLMEAALAIQLHIATVLIVLAMTLVILPLKKGTRLHKTAGRVWVAAMMATAFVSFGINTTGSPWGVGPIHIFSVIVLISVPWAIYDIRKGNVKGHRTAMISVTVGGLGIAGALAMAPGRFMWSVLFG